MHSTDSPHSGKTSRLKFSSDPRGFTLVTLPNRNPNDYVDHVRHCIRAGETIPHPRDATEATALTEAFPEVAAHVAECGVVW